MTEHGRAYRVRPDQRFGAGAGAFAAFLGQRSRDVGDCSWRASASSFNRPAMPTGVDGSLSERGGETVECVVQLFAGRRSWIVGNPAQGFAHQVERISDPGEPLRIRSADAWPFPRRHSTGRSSVRRDSRYRPRRCISDPADEDRACRTNCRNDRGSARARSSIARVASSRSTVSIIPIQPKSRAAATDKRYRPRLVGDVRWATTGTGSS